jgi:hypothetical protein
MEGGAYVDRVRAALQQHGYDVSSTEVGGSPVIAGRRSDFRWTWFAVRLHTSVIVRRFTATEATLATLDRYLDECSHWAVANRRGSRALGLQSGTAAVAVAVIEGGGGEGPGWASHPHGRRFAALAYPVAVDLGAGTVVEPKRMVFGGIFVPFLRGVVADVMRAPLS